MAAAREDTGRPGTIARATRWVDTHAVHLVVAVLGVVLIATAVYAVMLGDELRFPDEREYIDLAQQLGDTGRFAGPDGRPTAYRPPGYPFVLAAIAWLGGDVVAMRLANVVFHVAAVFFVAVIAHRIAPPRAGPLAALAAGLSPVAVYTAGTLYAQTFSAFLLMAALALVLQSFGDDGTPTAGRAAAAGLVLGWLVLTTPTTLGAAAFVVVWAAWRARARRAWRAVVVMAVVMVFPLVAWTARNTFVFDTPVGLGTQTGINLLLGNSENTRPNSGVNVDLSRYRAVSEDMSEVEKDRYYTRAAVRWVLEHPGEAAKLYAAKVLNFFNYRNELYVEQESSVTRDLLVLVTYWPILAIVVVRLLAVRWMPLRPAETLVLGIYAVAALSLAIFFTRIRFRVPFDYALASLAAAAVAMVIGREHRRGGPAG